MKKLFTLIALLYVFCSYGQVVISLQGKYQGSLVNLDFIIVENLSHPGKMALPAPPGITTYFIDLMNGYFNGVLQVTSNTAQVEVLSLIPGFTRVSVNLAINETVQVTLYTMDGAVYRKWTSECRQGQNIVGISAACQGILICRLSGRDFSFAFKLPGNSDAVTACNTA